jgi:glycosyltransferase involved in cell wall biosynthesis
MSPGEVLFVAEQLRSRVPGGIGTYVAGLVEALPTIAPDPVPDVTLLASRAKSPDPISALGRPVRLLPLPSRLLVKAWDLGTVRLGRGFRVVHAPSVMTPPTTVPLVVAVHDLAWRRVPSAYPARGRRWHEAALGRALRRGGRFVVPSETVAGELGEALGPGGAGRVELVEYGADHLPAPDHAAAVSRLRRLGVEGEFLLAVGTLEPRKNLARLLAAYSLVRPSLPEPWPLVLVGPRGWGAGRAPGEGVAGPVPEGVCLAGAVPGAELSALYGSCRCLAYVSLFEGFGLPVAEAMRAGAPVVASRVPAAGGAALEVDPLDVESIAEGLLAASTDEGRRAQLVAAGRVRASRLTWSAAAAAHARVWRQAAEEGDGRRRAAGRR